MIQEIYNKLPEVVKNLFVNTDCTLTEVDYIEDAPDAVGIFEHRNITKCYAIKIVRNGDYPVKKDNTVYHEFGHLLDYGYDEQFRSDSKIFEEIYEAESDAFMVDGGYVYATSTPREYFATAFAEYMTNPDRLREYTPMTYDYIEHVLKLTSIEELMYEKQIAKNRRFREAINDIESLSSRELLEFTITYRKEICKAICATIKGCIKGIFRG